MSPRAGPSCPRSTPAPEPSASGINLQATGLTSFPGFPHIANPTFNLYSIGGTVSYDLDLFGGRRRATEADQARVDRAARDADAAYLTLTGNVALQAMRIAGLRAQIAVVQQVIADDERINDMVRRAQAAGAESRSALSSGVAQLAADQSLLPPIQRELDAARHQMALLVGKSPADWTAPAFDLASFAAATDVPVSLPSTLVRRRPDILAAEADLHAATAEIGIATANLYPNIRLSAGITQGVVNPEDSFHSANSGWNLVSGLSAPIFHGGTLRAHRRVAEAEARASLARYQQTVLRAFVQVSDVALRARQRRPADRRAQSIGGGERLRRSRHPDRLSAGWRTAGQCDRRGTHAEPFPPCARAGAGPALRGPGAALHGDRGRLASASRYRQPLGRKSKAPGRSGARGRAIGFACARFAA